MNCRYVARDSPRIIPGRHTDNCAGECTGCQPCEQAHCQLQWHGTHGDCQTHADTICPACLGKTREHLTEIIRLTGIPLVAETLTRGTRSEAADLLGPTADPHAWIQRGRYGHTYHPDTRIGENHPNWILGTWTLRASMHLGHIGPNTTTPAEYLQSHLTELTDWEDFPDLATDLEGCRTHLEAVLHEGEQIDQGAPCLSCGALLEKRWDVGQLGRDGWACPRCHQLHTADQYDFAMRHAYLEHAEWLTAEQMTQRTGVRRGTVIEWARRKHVRKRTAPITGLVEYAVADVLLRVVVAPEAG